MRLSLLLAALALSACVYVPRDQEGLAVHSGGMAVSDATRLTLPDGSAAWFITCGQVMNACMERARALCPNGLVMRDSETTGQGGSLVASQAGLFGVSKVENTIAISCSPEGA